MSISTELSRIQANRNTIRTKLVELGMATSTDNLDRLAAAIEGIVNQGAISVTVTEGKTISIPAGYHNGSGTVTAVSDIEGDATKYKLQSKSVTPTKKQQPITPDSGYYGLSDVTVAAIPDAYQDVSSTTATAGDVLTGKIYVLADGTVTTGTMPNNGAANKTLDITTVSYTIPKGYHNGSGKVQLVVETKNVTPTKSAQTITPTSGKVLSQVNVAAIPAAYQDVTAVTAGAAEVLSGKVIVDATGKEVTGTMPNNGTFMGYIDNVDDEIVIPKGYHDGNGGVTIAEAEWEKIYGGANIRAGVTVLGVTGGFTNDATAVAADVLNGKIAYSKGAKVTGTMPNNGAIERYINRFDDSVTVPKGYHDGTGAVAIDAGEQEKLSESGNIKHGVEILGVTGSFTSDGTITAANVLSGAIGYSKGSKVIGNMANNGLISDTIDGLTATSVTIPAGYTTGGTVSLTGDIEEALAAI